MGERKLGTSGGVALTEALLAKLADEAEGGYEIGRLRVRSRRGRPPLGEEPATVFQVRLETTLRTALERAADAEGTTPSDITRRALRGYLQLEGAEPDPPAEGESASIQEFALSFTVVECARCRTERAAGIYCPQCGHKPDTDPHVERRREILASTKALFVADYSEAGEQLQFDAGLLGEIAEWLTSLIGLCAKAAKEEDVADEVDALIRRLRQWERDLAATPQYRPYLWYWRVIADLIGQLNAVAQTYLESLTSASPQEAERLGNEAQAGIDHAASVAQAVSHLLNRWSTIEQAADDDDPMAVLIAIAQAEAGERTQDGLLAPDALSAELYERVTGDRNCPPWLALGLRLTDIQIDPLLDRDRFWECAALTYRRIATRSRKGKAALAQVASSSNWIRDLQGIHEEMFEIGSELRSLAPQFDRPKALARALVRFGHQLAERCAPALLATVIAAYRQRSYEELSAKDIGALLSEAEDVGLNSLLFGIDRALRHGDAHRKLFQISSDGVTFSADKREYDHLTWEQLFDRVLGGWESVSALMTGILCAVETAGVSVDALDPLAQLDVSVESRLKFVLAAIGWHEVSIEGDEQAFSIRARADRFPTRLGFLGYLIPYLPDEGRLTVTVEAHGNKHSWAGPTEGLAVFGTSAPEEEKQAAILRILATWTEDGEPLTSSDQLRKLAAVHVMQWTIAEASFETRIRNVLMIHEVATRAQDTTLAAVLDQVVQGLRLIAAGHAPKDWERTVAQLSRWGGVEVTPPAILGTEPPSGLNPDPPEPKGEEMDGKFWEELRANTEIAVHRSDDPGVRLRGGPMNGWLVKKNAPSLARDWHKTWPPRVAAKNDPGRYELSDSGTWAEWKPLADEG